MSNESMTPLRLTTDGPLSGTIGVPGDKSISHRALIFGALAVGRSEIHGLLESEDIFRTADALRAMGATIVRHSPGRWQIDGVGVGSLLQPEQALDMGNSGTSTRLLMGLVATHPIEATFIGDASLSGRPMGRVTEPLSATGAEFHTSPGGRLPLTVRGITPAIPLHYRLPVASAQVKSAVLLAGLNTRGRTVVEEPVPSRDHSERMLKGCGAKVEILEKDGVREIHLQGPATLKPFELHVPGDISSAAFPLVAAAIVSGSVVTLTAVNTNPTRDGLLHALELIGARIVLHNRRIVSGEPVADIEVRHVPLHGATLPPSLAPSMIDEYPVLFVAAALASGRTEIRGIQELRVKESDRIALMARGLRAAGAQVEELDDGLIIEGSGGRPLAGGNIVDTALDHRIAMSFSVLSLAAQEPVTVSDRSPIATSFPDFVGLMQQLGAREA